MKKLDKNFIFIVIMLIFSGMVSWYFYILKDYQQGDTVDIHQFPQQIGSWTSKELPITEEEYAILETRNVFAREYTNTDGNKVYLLIVYSQNNRKVSHPPEICYTGNGVTILAKTLTKVNLPNLDSSINVNRLLLEQGDTKQVSFYWFKVGDMLIPSYWKQQALIALKTLFSQSASSALIRISTPVNTDEAQANELVQSFVQLLIPLLHQYLL